MSFVILAAALAGAMPVTSSPPPVVLSPPPSPIANLAHVFVPMMPMIFRPLPESGKFAVDFTVQPDGQVTLCLGRALQGRDAKLGAVPVRCPSRRYPPYRDSDGTAVRRNVSFITTLVVADVP
ncbi:MAG: hypothetical protein RLZZ136_49 [Pseudomonadota bacterium]|jgi:hypothetical protein